MIRLGIAGTNYGGSVLLPAFRLDRRCEVVALAGSDAARTAEIANRNGIAGAFGDWRAMIERSGIDAIAIATPPRLQSEIAIAALSEGKPVFAEKPMAADLAGARAMLRASGSRPAMVDFNFTEIGAWQKTKAMLDAGAIGRLRHVAVNWNVENVSTRLRLKNWKTSAAEGGGALGNLASHSLHAFEWFCGPIVNLTAQLSGLPDDPSFETNVTLALSFQSGASGSFAMSCASYLGSGHRLEFYGEEGALTLNNPTGDYMRGFRVSTGKRPGTAMEPVPLEDDPVDRQFPAEARVAPVSRLASRFIDAIEQGHGVTPGFAEGYRVQVLLDAVRRSHTLGQRISVAPGGPS